jgi:hypothetical protein
MKYFPNYLTNIPFAVSASITSQSRFLDNFSSTPIDTASLALNISGSVGANGTSVLVTGPQGPQGFAGFAGPPGSGIYLLPATRTYCACFPHQVTTDVTYTDPDWSCATVDTTKYSPCEIIGAGCYLYDTPECDLATIPQPVPDDNYAFSNNEIYYATGGQLSYVGSCIAV